MRVPGPRAEATAVDAFDLPGWVGEQEVTWRPFVALHTPLVSGELAPAAGSPEQGGSDAAEMACDVLACDRAYPEPVLPESWRREAHSRWAMGEVLLLEIAGRLTLVCPGVDVEVGSALESLRRLAKAVGAPSARFTAALRL